MEVTDPGRTMEVKPLHSQNADSPMEVTEEGKIIDYNLSQPQNT